MSYIAVPPLFSLSKENFSVHLERGPEIGGKITVTLVLSPAGSST